MIIAIANQKGGVGKTTTALNLSVALAELGRSVLAVDLDPQANLTAGLNAAGSKPTIYDVLLGDTHIEDAAVSTDYDGVWLLPSELDLAAMELSLAQEPDTECLLRAVEPLNRRFDYILTDCPPYLGQLTVAALTAADGVIVPMLPSVWAVSGLGRLLASIDAVGARMLGIVLTNYDKRTAVSSEMWNDLVKMDHPLFKTRIPHRVAAEYAAIAQMSVLQYEPEGTLARAYRRLAKEVDALA